MTAYDFMLSESQERMLVVVKQGKEKQVISAFQKFYLQYFYYREKSRLLI